MRSPNAHDDQVHSEAAEDKVPEPGMETQKGHEVDVRDAEGEEVAEVRACTGEVNVDRCEGVRDEQSRDELVVSSELYNTGRTASRDDSP